jgi:Reverse transcriptase (RNA-dependent DNA polymerase)
MEKGNSGGTFKLCEKRILEDGQQRPSDQELKKKVNYNQMGFKKKAQQDGSIRYRTRCVARGFMQIPGVDFTESFASVADTSIKLVIGIYLYLQKNHPKLNWVLETLDVEAAFLNAIPAFPSYIEWSRGIL